MPPVISHPSWSRVLVDGCGFPNGATARTNANISRSSADSAPLGRAGIPLARIASDGLGCFVWNEFRPSAPNPHRSRFRAHPYEPITANMPIADSIENQVRASHSTEHRRSIGMCCGVAHFGHAGIVIFTMVAGSGHP